MKDDVKRFTNLEDHPCKECQAQPGEQHLVGCVTGDRDIAQDNPSTRRELAKIARNAKAAAAARFSIQEIERSLALQGYPKAVIRRALDDLQLSERQLPKWDTAYAIVRAAFGIPIQEDAFTGEDSLTAGERVVPNATPSSRSSSRSSSSSSSRAKR